MSNSKTNISEYLLDTAVAIDNGSVSTEIQASLAEVGYDAALGATAEQNKAYEQAKAWMNAFKRIARRALQARPDLLLKLGM